MLSRVIGWVLGAADRMTAAPCPQEVGFYRVAVGRRAWGSFTLAPGEGDAAAMAPSAGSAVPGWISFRLILNGDRLTSSQIAKFLRAMPAPIR